MPHSKKIRSKSPRWPQTAREAELLRDLEDALSADERAHAFAGALFSLDEGGRKRLLQRLGPETAQVLAPILAGKSSKGSKA